MAVLFFTIIAMLSVGKVTAFFSLQKYEMHEMKKPWHGQEAQRKAQESDLEASRDWRATCLSISKNQTMQDLSRKGYIAFLARSISQQLAVEDNVHGTTQARQQGTSRARNPSLQNKGKRDPSVTREVSTKLVFSNKVKHERGMRGVVTKFVLRVDDLRQLTSVKLWVYTTCSVQSAHQTAVVMKLYSKDRKKMNKCSSKLAKLHDNKWKRIPKGWIAQNITVQIKTLWEDVKRTCKKSPKKGLSLLIKYTKCISSEVHKTADGKKWAGPHLELVTTDGPLITRKIPLECTAGEKRCCRQRSTVSLKELKLTSRVIVPRKFQINNCRGLCSMDEGRRAKPCCIPTKTSSMSIIVFSKNGHFSMKTLSDVVVNECGCV